MTCRSLICHTGCKGSSVQGNLSFDCVGSIYILTLRYLRQYKSIIYFKKCVAQACLVSSQQAQSKDSWQFAETTSNTPMSWSSGCHLCCCVHSPLLWSSVSPFCPITKADEKSPSRRALLKYSKIHPLVFFRTFCSTSRGQSISQSSAQWNSKVWDVGFFQIIYQCYNSHQCNRKQVLFKASCMSGIRRTRQ